MLRASIPCVVVLYVGVEGRGEDDVGRDDDAGEAEGGVKVADVKMTVFGDDVEQPQLCAHLTERTSNQQSAIWNQESGIRKVLLATITMITF